MEGLEFILLGIPEKETDKSNVDKLLLELRSVQDKDRSARFKCCLVLIQDSQSDPISF